MSDHPKVAIFWDYENCCPPSNSCGLGYDIVNNISRMARLFGSITTFRAYLDISAQSPKSVILRSELQSSGVSMIDCPHNGKKDVVDKMVLVDMLAFAVDHPAPATIILIAGDRDYAYAVSTLKLRKYQVILVVPSLPHTSPSLESQASLVVDWGAAALRTRAEVANSTQAVKHPYLDIDANLVTKLLRELQALPLDDPDTPYSINPQSVSKPRRVTARDLLEPLSHSKCTGSFGSIGEFTHTPPSPRKPTSTGSEPAPQGPSISKTPSRSRHTSVSTAFMRARSATIATQSPPAAEDIPAKESQSSSTTRSCTSDIGDVDGPAKRSLSVLPSLDVLELSLDDNGPPSSIIVRSTPESDPSIDGILASGKPGTPSPHKLNRLASPFVLPKAPTRSEPVINPGTMQPHATAKPTSFTVVPAKAFTEAVTNTYQTPQLKDIGVPKGIERLAGLRIEDDDTSPEWSTLHRVHSQQGTRDTTCAPEPNYHWSDVPHSTRSPLSKHVSPPAAIPFGFDDCVDSTQFTAFSRSSDTLYRSAASSDSVASSSAFPSVPFSVMESHERDESEWRQTWTVFEPLIRLLLAARENGIAHPLRSTIALDLVQSDKQVYQRAGVSRFRDYAALAEKVGIVELGGRDGGAWIALHQSWVEDDITPTHVLSNRIPSPTFDPPNAIQNPLLTGSKATFIERTAIFQSPVFTSPSYISPDGGDTLPAVPTDRQNNAARASIPAQFQPLIDILIRTRAEGSYQALRSVVGQQLGQDVYARAGVPGFKEYVHQASEAQLVQFGGVGGHAWIRLHPELRI